MPFRSLRRWIRRGSKPIPEHVALTWKRRLSYGYGFLAWNAIAVVCYAAYNGKRDWAAYHGLEVEKGTPCKSNYHNEVFWSDDKSHFSSTVLKNDGHLEGQSDQIFRLQKDG